MSNKRKLNKYLSKKSLALYYFYAFGLWMLFFLYKDSKLPDNAQSSIWEILFKGLLMAGITLVISVGIIKLIKNRSQKRRVNDDKSSLN